MVRRLVILSVVGLGLALAALFVFRAAAVEALIANALAARGIAVGGLSVTRSAWKNSTSRSSAWARTARCAPAPCASAIGLTRCCAARSRTSWSRAWSCAST